MSAPNRNPAPRGDKPQPSISSGSDQRRSHIAPSCGTSCLRSKIRILSTVSIRGDSPPWTQSTAPLVFPGVPVLHPDAPEPGAPVLDCAGELSAELGWVFL